MLQAIRRLSKALAYGYAVYLSLRWYPRIGSETIDGGVITTGSYWFMVIVLFILAWIITLLTDWIFADKEINTAIPEQVEPIFSENPSAELSTLKPSLVEEHEVTVVQPELTLETLQGSCHVIDGDTIVIGKQKIRFAGMNAPELNEPYGKQAKWALVELCKGQTITAYPTGETSFDRIVAKCFLPDGRDLAAEMVKMELALDIPHFPNADYKEFETPNSRRKLNWKPKK